MKQKSLSILGLALVLSVFLAGCGSTLSEEKALDILNDSENGVWIEPGFRINILRMEECKLTDTQKELSGEDARWEVWFNFLPIEGIQQSGSADLAARDEYNVIIQHVDESWFVRPGLGQGCRLLW